MPRPLSRDMAIARLTKVEVTDKLATMTDAKRAIADMPTADVAPMVHGRWKVIEGTIENAVCSNCGRHFQSYYEAYHFCPNCGAKMDGGAE